MTSRSLSVEISPRDLESIHSMWGDGLGEAYDAYRDCTDDHRAALAAALVETGVGLQGIGSHVAEPGHLLIGDLCLARASRLLADTADQGLQVALARVVERLTTEAADGGEVSDVRPLLRAALGAGR